MKQWLLSWACLAMMGIATSAQAQQMETFFYDALGRLSATTKAPTSGGFRTRYGLDAAGNRTVQITEAAHGRTANDQLLPGQDLLPGQKLVSADGRFIFVLQEGDSNAVIYGPSGGLWSTNTASGRGTVLSLQTDGNLVMRGTSNDAVWDSGTAGHPGARLVMQNDGNLVLYDGGTGIWHTGTCCY